MNRLYRSPVSIAVARGNKDAVKTFCDAGHANFRGLEFSYPIHVAVLKGDVEMFNVSLTDISYCLIVTLTLKVARSLELVFVHGHQD